jgi:hypothetical protein
MLKESRLLVKLKRHWTLKLDGNSDIVDRFSLGGFHPGDSSLSTTELIAGCSLMAARKPTYEILEAIEILVNECVTPIFTDEFFVQFQAVIQEMECAGLRAHGRKLRKLGHAIAARQRVKYWQQRWSNEISRKLTDAIRDEPFLPQRG